MTRSSGTRSKSTRSVLQIVKMERRILKKTTYTEQLSRFRELYDNGLNDKQIAAQLGIPAIFVNLERTSLGLPPIISRRIQQEKVEAEAADKKRRETPPLAKVRESNLTPITMARDIMAEEGRCREIIQLGVTVYLLDGRNATPFQWIEAADKVLVREGLPVIGRGGWN